MATALKETRREYLEGLEVYVDQVKGASEAARPNLRQLEQRIKELEDYLPEVKSAHIRYAVKEKDEELKKAAKEELLKALNDADLVLFPAKDKVDTLVAAQTAENSLPEDQQMELLKERVETVVESLNARGKIIKDGLMSEEAINHAQLDRFHDMVADIRRDAPLLINPYFEEIYEKHKANKEKLLGLDNDRKSYLKPIYEELDTLEKKIVEKTPEKSSPSTIREIASVSSSNSSSSSSSALTAYKSYQKRTIPRFKGEFREYPSWKDEFVEEILPSFDQKQQIRLLNEYTPKEIQLKNCSTIEEAWLKLDSKYANPFLVTSILIDDFVKFVPKGKTAEAKLVDLRDMLVKMEDDLTSVKSEKELSSNTWLHNKVVQDLPMYWQTKFVEDEEDLVRKEGSRWKAMFNFIKEESLRIETK